MGWAKVNPLIRIQPMAPNETPTLELARSRGIVEKELSYKIVGAFFRVYNELGFGYIEPIYAAALAIELKKLGLLVEREHPVVVMYKGVEVGHHRLDFLVERRIVIEIKSTEKINDIAKRQLRNYLSVLDFELGLLLHFGPRAESHRVLRKRKAEPLRSNSAHLTNSDEGLCSAQIRLQGPSPGHVPQP
jgi:GxxExxY protein